MNVQTENTQILNSDPVDISEMMTFDVRYNLKFVDVYTFFLRYEKSTLVHRQDLPCLYP